MRRCPVSLLSFLLLPQVPFPSPQLAVGTPPQPRLPGSRSIEVPRIPPPRLLPWEQEASSWGPAASPVKLRVGGPGVGLAEEVPAAPPTPRAHPSEGAPGFLGSAASPCV